jgi:hypothetical protein
MNWFWIWLEFTTAAAIFGLPNKVHTLSVTEVILRSTLVPTNSGVCIQNKISSTYMEDDFQIAELDLLKKYIKPQDKRSVQ